MSFHEFPKHVYPDSPDGTYEKSPSKKGYVVVNDAAEEETAMGGSPVVREADEKARLMKLAEVKGVKVDGRWTVEKMAKAIADAGFDASLNPFE